MNNPIQWLDDEDDSHLIFDNLGNYYDTDGTYYMDTYRHVKYNDIVFMEYFHNNDNISERPCGRPCCEYLLDDGRITGYRIEQDYVEPKVISKYGRIVFGCPFCFPLFIVRNFCSYNYLRRKNFKIKKVISPWVIDDLSLIILDYLWKM